MRGSFLEHFVADARRYLDKKYPTHGPFGARNRDRFFFKVEQGLKVSGILCSILDTEEAASPCFKILCHRIDAKCLFPISSLVETSAWFENLWSFGIAFLFPSSEKYDMSHS